MNLYVKRDKAKKTAAVFMIFIIMIVLACETTCAYAAYGNRLENKGMNKLYFDERWNLDYIDAPEAWDLIDALKPFKTRSDEDRISVAVLDTGVNVTHPNLTEMLNIEHCVSVIGSTPQTYLMPKHGHGTKVTGIIGAMADYYNNYSGVATGNSGDLIDLCAINVYKDEGYKNQYSVTTENLIKGLDYAEKIGARVVNLSLGFDDAHLDSEGNVHDNALIENKINELTDRGIAVVASAGNRKCTDDWYPGSFEACINVINTKKYVNPYTDCRAESSNYGGNRYISAPGDGTKSTGVTGGIKSASGTSASAPAVTGVAALMLYMDPSLSVAEVKDILYSTATDLTGTKGYDKKTGYGNVNAFNAVAETARRLAEKKKGFTKEEVEKAIKKTCPYETGGRTLKSPVITKIKKGKNSLTVRFSHSCKRVHKVVVYRSAKKKGTYKSAAKLLNGEMSWTDENMVSGKEKFYKVQIFGYTTDGKKRWSAKSECMSAVPR